MPYNNRTTSLREKLTLQVGRPVTIALEYSTGKRVPSNYTDGAEQMYYSLTDGRCWYADLAAAELIENLDLASREPFTVCKLAAGRFEVQRAGEFPTQPISNPDTRHRVNDKGEFIDTPARRAYNAIPPQRTAARLGGERAAETSGHLIGGQAPANSQNESTTPRTQAEPATKLEQALKTAILASANAEKYGAEIGYTVRFTPEAIKCMAISVLIGMEQGGRR